MIKIDKESESDEDVIYELHPKLGIKLEDFTAVYSVINNFLLF